MFRATVMVILPVAIKMANGDKAKTSYGNHITHDKNNMNRSNHATGDIGTMADCNRPTVALERLVSGMRSGGDRPER